MAEELKRYHLTVYSREGISIGKIINITCPYVNLAGNVVEYYDERDLKAILMVSNFGYLSIEEQ